MPPKPKTKSRFRPVKPERDRAIHELLRALRHMSSREAAELSGLSTSTINNWRAVRTKYPQHISLVMAAAAAGYEYKLVKKGNKDDSSK